MKMRCLPIAALICGLFVSSSAQAQGLIWSLPPDRSSVRYEGTYKQVVRRPNNSEGDLSLEWTRYLTIKSVGSTEAEFRGVNQPCRWIEFKSETGKIEEGIISPGPGGTRLYKILVPESVIEGTINDNGNIYLGYIPIVRGYRKLGAEDPEQITSGVFQAYPGITFLRHYRQLEPVGQPETISLPFADVTGQALKGELQMESTSVRSTNTATLWKSDDVPFGLAKWNVKIVEEGKQSTSERTEIMSSG